MNGKDEQSLARWLLYQKLMYHAGRLSKSKVRKLEKLKVDWQLTKAEWGWLTEEFREGGVKQPDADWKN